MIQPVIVRVDSQSTSVDRLVRHIKELDGTDVKVIPLTSQDDAGFKVDYPKNEKACRAAFSLHHAAKAMRGKPFIWLEHDSIPLKAGWVSTLTKEYQRLKKPFLLSIDSNPPHDIVGGIGVYSGDTEWMIPTQYRQSGWDLWMVQNLSPLIARTPLIQHSYGTYNVSGHATPHQFPRDSALLRGDAVIFHRDATHSLLTAGTLPDSVIPEKVFAHSGDLGDVIFSLEVIRRLGGGRLMLCSEMGFKFPSRTREEMTPSRAENIKPLLLAQGYITGVEHFSGPPKPEWTNLNRFREIFKGTQGRACTSLQRAHLRRFGLSVQDETQPWLTAPHSKKSPAICIARSPRYHNPEFPWKQLVERFGSAMGFVGLPSEYEAFSTDYGKIPHIQTKNLMDVASVIAGAKMFIGNQSCPYAIAESLKKPAVQESWPHEPNCLFQRQNLLNLTVDFGRIAEFAERFDSQ